MRPIEIRFSHLPPPDEDEIRGMFVDGGTMPQDQVGWIADSVKSQCELRIATRVTDVLSGCMDMLVLFSATGACGADRSLVVESWGESPWALDSAIGSFVSSHSGVVVQVDITGDLRRQMADEINAAHETALKVERLAAMLNGETGPVSSVYEIAGMPQRVPLVQ